MGTAGRQGLGKLRHLKCHSLWLQQRFWRKEFCLLKFNGKENPADLFTKRSESANKLDQLISLFNCKIEVGRPAAAPQLKKSGEQRANADEHQCNSALGLTTDTG